MSTTDIGKNAEELVADKLKSEKHNILEMNWRTRWCEIDIISKKDGVVYFIEVKFRSSNEWGDGFSYLTPKKLKQMRFAAELWLSDNGWSGEAQLIAASVDSNYNIEMVEI